MTKKGKIVMSSLLSLALIASLVYCVQFGKTPEEKMAEVVIAEAQDAMTDAAQLVEDAETAWQNGKVTQITLADKEITASTSGIQVQGQTATILTGGIYQISGSLTEGQLAVNCKDEVVLILDTVEITNTSDAALSILDAEHTLIYLPEGSESKLVSGTQKEIIAATQDEAQGTTQDAGQDASQDEASGAALYSKDNLSIAGSGTLCIEGYQNNAIASTDHLTIYGGNLDLIAANNGLKGKDSVKILDGTIHIQSGNDGIKSNNDTDEDCGNIIIRGGQITIESLGDGISAERNLTVEDGSITIQAGSPSLSENSLAMPAEGTKIPAEEGVMPPALPQDGEIPAEEGTMPPALPQDGEIPAEEGTMPPTMPQDGTGQKWDGNMTPPDSANHGGREMMRGEKFQNGQFRTPNGQFQTPDGQFQTPDGQFQTPDGQFQTPDGQFQNPRGQMKPDFDMFGKETTKTSSSDTSAKGLKCGGSLTISGGTITINSTDDCIHSNETITVSGGTVLLATEDDGFHADDALIISDGKITITKSYEGLEGNKIYINGGEISVTASDDGINAGGDTSPLPLLQICGGSIYVNADGDGLDSNGDLIVEGGTIFIDGPSNSGNGALDSGSENGGSLLANGGSILAIGASGMAETFGSDSTQCSFLQNYATTFPAGTQITIKDESGKVLLEHTSAKTFNSIVFSSPELEIGKTYTITVGDQTDTIASESISNGNAGGFGGMGGFGGRMR